MMRAGCPPLLRRLDHAVDQYTLGEIEAERGLYESVAGLAMSTRLSMQVMRASKMYVNFSHAWLINDQLSSNGPVVFVFGNNRVTRVGNGL